MSRALLIVKDILAISQGVHAAAWPSVRPTHTATFTLLHSYIPAHSAQKDLCYGICPASFMLLHSCLLMQPYSLHMHSTFTQHLCSSIHATALMLSRSQCSSLTPQHCLAALTLQHWCNRSHSATFMPLHSSCSMHATAFTQHSCSCIHVSALLLLPCCCAQTSSLFCSSHTATLVLQLSLCSIYAAPLTPLHFSVTAFTLQLSCNTLPQHSVSLIYSENWALQHWCSSSQAGSLQVDKDHVELIFQFLALHQLAAGSQGWLVRGCFFRGNLFLKRSIFGWGATPVGWGHIVYVYPLKGCGTAE